MGYLASECEALHTLNVSLCEQISDRAMVPFASGLFNLRILSMAACRLTDEGLTKVAKTLQELHTLNIGQCSAVTDAGLEQVAAGLSGLRSIDLYGCSRVTREAAAALGAAVEVNTKLWH